ncbi:ABC transporter ATP-binding protein [Lignipirellula cremea]|uniref:ABC transporter ATP-binding protein n=1 Tax=Lignipirellula cremea TaxID=2528010 RepID=UPI0018D229DD|nr:ABC transporter ATP-binding protein [Lignipirellula cremea]
MESRRENAPGSPVGPVAICVNDLKKTYHTGLLNQHAFVALRGISFRVNQGEIFGLLGPNGAGKTTFIKVLLGIVRATAGSASLFDLPAGSNASRRLVGYLPENLSLPRHLTANTALEYYGNLNNVPTRKIQEKRQGLLELVGIADRAGDAVGTYSKGMRQRLGLAQALLHDPRILVLDEPTDGLDPGARSQVRKILTDLKEQGVTVFLNSHLLQEVELICDRVAVLDRGELRFVGSVREIGELLESSAQGGGRLEVTLELLAGAEVVERLFTGASVLRKEATRDKEWRITAHFADQAAVDAQVDRLRSAGASIVGLSRRKSTLEDAFLQLTTPASDPT